MSALSLQSLIGGKDAARNSCLKKKQTEKILIGIYFSFGWTKKKWKNREIVIFFRFE